MKRVVAALVLLACLLPTLRSNAQVQVCDDYTQDFGAVWEIYAGTVGGAFSVSYVRNSDKASIADVGKVKPIEFDTLGEIRAHIGPTGAEADWNHNDFSVKIVMAQNNAITYKQTFTYAWLSSLDIRIALPTVPVDKIYVTVLQPTDNPGNQAQPFAWQVTRLCGPSPFPTATNTPLATNVPNTPTPGPSHTPYPTSTPTLTRTPTPTRTPVPTWTALPTQTALPTFTPTFTRTPTATRTGTMTPTPSETPGLLTPTDTPAPTSTPAPTDTPDNSPTDTPVPTLTQAPQPTQPPQQSTLAEYEYSTPIPPNAECTDWTDPCAFFPTVPFPDPDLRSPTPVSGLPTLTALPSLTAAAESTHGTPAIPQEVSQLSTAVWEINDIQRDADLQDGSGTAVPVAQRFYEMGQSIGGVFGPLRTLVNSDVGPIGSLLLVLLAMIVLNIQLRIILFIVPVVIKILQFIFGIVQTILKFIPFIMLAALLIFSPPQRIDAATPTPTRTWTPAQTWTPTGTLHAPAATATSKYQGLRPTPSPLPTSNGTGPYFAAFDMHGKAIDIADNGINIYRYFNSSGVLDIAAFIGLLLVVVVLGLRIQKRLTKDV